jgi:hypothetical protein
MARYLLFISLIVIIGSTLLLGCNKSGPDTVYEQLDPVDAKTEQHILAATVQITMVREEILETGIGSNSENEVIVSWKTVSAATKGIGTLISVEDEVVLVTHNHWSQMVGYSRPDRVRFLNAQGEWLLEIGGIEFQHNILYRDGGTLIMRAPQALVNELNPVQIVRGSLELVPGATVHLVTQQPGSETQVGLLAAQVITIGEHGQHSVMTLQSMNGQSIEPGDSGGGIWSNGALVGNMWMTIREEWRHPNNPEESNIVGTDRSRAAGLTESLLQLTGQSLQITEELPAVLEELAME